MDREHMRGLFLACSHRPTGWKELEGCLVHSLGHCKRERGYFFYAWQDLALEFHVPRKAWSRISILILEKLEGKGDSFLREHFLCSLFFYPKLDPSLRESLSAMAAPHALFLFRDGEPSKELLHKVFASELNVLAFRFGAFLKDLPPSREVANRMWDLAISHYRDKTRLIAGALSSWGGALEEEMERDFFAGPADVNGQMIMALRLERKATWALGKGGEGADKGAVLAQWKEVGVRLDEEALVEVLWDRYREGGPVPWKEEALALVEVGVFWPLLWERSGLGKDWKDGAIPLLKETPKNLLPIASLVHLFEALGPRGMPMAVELAAHFSKEQELLALFLEKMAAQEWGEEDVAALLSEYNRRGLPWPGEMLTDHMATLLKERHEIPWALWSVVKSTLGQGLEDVFRNLNKEEALYDSRKMEILFRHFLEREGHPFCREYLEVEDPSFWWVRSLHGLGLACDDFLLKALARCPDSKSYWEIRYLLQGPLKISLFNERIIWDVMGDLLKCRDFAVALRVSLSQISEKGDMGPFSALLGRGGLEGKREQKYLAQWALQEEGAIWKVMDMLLKGKHFGAALEMSCFG